MALNEAAKPAPSSASAVLAPLFAGGLLFLFLGERIVTSPDWLHMLLTGVGCLSIVVSTVMRFREAARLEGERRTVERRMGVLSLVGMLGVAAYFATTETGKKVLGIATAKPETRAHVEGALLVAMVFLILVSVIPLLLDEIALFSMRRATQIEARRVVAATFSGVTLALAIVYCALITYGVGELEIKWDYSYYRTSRASESTKNIAANLNEPVKIQSFFPDLNEVGTEVNGYLREVRAASGKIELETLDRLMVPQIAKDAKVTSDGVIVLSRGASRETITIGSEMKSSAAKLKTLDSDFQKSLLKVLRDAKIAYFTVGHGELNEASGDAVAQGRSGKLIKKLLESQNYVVKDIGLVQGLGNEIPDDATIVFVLGPSNPFLPEEIATLKKYAEKGGHLFIAADPDARVDLSALLAVADITWDPTVLANDKSYLKHDYKPSDRRILVTNRFSSHPSVTTLSRNSGRAGLIFVAAAAIDKKDRPDEKIDFVVRAQPDTFNDKNGNFEFDSGEGEKRSSFNLAAAVSHPAPGGKGTPPEMRAFVVGDADCLSDAVLPNDTNAVFALDAIRWLGGEESFSGSITSNEDVRIEHTKQKDQLFFYATIFGAPGLVAAIGFAITRRKRGDAQRMPPPKKEPAKAKEPAAKKAAPKKAPAKKPEEKKPEPEKAEPAKDADEDSDDAEGAAGDGNDD